jgi:hypothetical protein
MLAASSSDTEFLRTNSTASTGAPPEETGTKVGAPPRVPLERPNSMEKGVVIFLRCEVAAAISSPGSSISDPYARIPKCPSPAPFIVS